MFVKNGIQLKEVPLADLPLFTKRLQEAFSIAVREKFGTTEPIPSAEEIRSGFEEERSETYDILFRGQQVGGVMLTIDGRTHRNSLDLFFISPEYHSQGLGLAAWQAIEEKYPDTAVWETITPYFEGRNIHFYINKCGFHIVEFFNPSHIDPNMSRPSGEEGGAVPGTETYFRFEKVMK